MLADANGVMPASLQFDAVQRFFESGLDGDDLVVHGRNSQEHLTHSSTRRRVIVTRKTSSIAVDISNRREVFWNPAGASFEQALAEFGAPNGSVAVIGGPGVFELFLDAYDVFYLSRADTVRIPGGRPIFPSAPLLAPEVVLANHGLDNPRHSLSDVSKGLTITAWRRSEI